MLFRFRDARTPDNMASVFLTSSLASAFMIILVVIPVLLISILMTWSTLKDLLATIL